MTTNPNRLLFDFYLNLLTTPEPFQLNHADLIAHTCLSIAYEIQVKPEVVESIFKLMAQEDKRWPK